MPTSALPTYLTHTAPGLRTSGPTTLYMQSSYTGPAEAGVTTGALTTATAQNC